MFKFKYFHAGHYLFLIITIICCLQRASAQDTAKINYRTWWNEAYPARPVKNPRAKLLPLIRVYKNRFVNAKGDTILFRGLSISDPDKIEHQGHWNKNHFEKIKEMGTMLVRIPVHPVAWRERTAVKYLQLLDQAADWCTDLGMYIIIDWHSIGNLKMELFQDPMYNTTQKETFEFWQTISRHFSGNNTVAFMNCSMSLRPIADNWETSAGLTGKN